MSEKEVDMEQRLSSLTEQLMAEKSISQQLRSEIDSAYMREKAALHKLKEFKEKLHNALVEKENLKAENDVFRSHLTENRKKMQRNRTTEEKEVGNECFILYPCL